MVGAMTNMHDHEIKFGMSSEQIIKYHLNEFKIPQCYNFPIGHIKNNKPIILGKKSRLRVTSSFVELIQ